MFPVALVCHISCQPHALTVLPDAMKCHRDAATSPVLNSLTDTTALSVGEVSRDTSGCRATTTCTDSLLFTLYQCLVNISRSKQ